LTTFTIPHRIRCSRDEKAVRERERFMVRQDEGLYHVRPVKNVSARQAGNWTLRMVDDAIPACHALPMRDAF
jgi:hypothetical protein